MRDRDAKLDEAIHEAAAILGDALDRLLFPESADFPVDSLRAAFGLYICRPHAKA